MLNVEEISSSCPSQQSLSFLNIWPSSTAFLIFFIVNAFVMFFSLCFYIHSFCGLFWVTLCFIFLLSDQWLTPLWQSPGPWGQILYVRWLLQGVHHPPDQQFRARPRARARARSGAQLRGLWTDTARVWLQTPSEHEDDWWWWWWWWSPQRWGTSQHFRVWVSVCEKDSKREHVWEHH